MPKYVFLHLLLMAALYTSVFGFISLLFGLIDYAIPDPLVHFYQGIPGGFHWALASLLIVFPVYLLVSWLLQWEFRRQSQWQQGLFRRWLIYFTLFLAALVIIGDLIVLISNLLEGDLTSRFVLKALVVLAVAAVVFVYYIFDLRRRETAFSAGVKTFHWLVIAAAVVSVAGGFLVAGSPLQQRAMRFDERRVSDLQNIQWQIVNYWQRKGGLPAALEDLRDEISGFVPPADPRSAEAYEYKILGDLSFEFCAVFETEAMGGTISGAAKPFPVSQSDVWSHGRGRVCFQRTLDPELYPRAPKREKF